MDLYFYDDGHIVHELPISRREAHLCGGLTPRCADSSKDAGVLAAHRPGIVLGLDRNELLKKCEDFIRVLQDDGDLLNYQYGLRTRRVDGSNDTRGSGRRGCVFHGAGAMACTGPGFAHITKTEMWDENGSRVSRTRVLHDLRDMQPVTVTYKADDAWIFSATRRRHPTDVLAKFLGLRDFLANSHSRSIRHWVTENAPERPMLGSGT